LPDELLLIIKRFSLRRKSVKIPVRKATPKHIIISAMVNFHPSIPKDRRIVVTVVAGVDMKNAIVEALDAP
jgi:hypothetical protein